MVCTVFIQRIRADRPEQTLETQIRCYIVYSLSLILQYLVSTTGSDLDLLKIGPVC